MTFDPSSAAPATQFDPLSATPDSGPPIRRVLEQALPVNPDQAAQTDKLSKRMGLPQDVVARNLTDVRMQDMVDYLDQQVKTSPVLLREMRNRQGLAQQAHDDVQPLTQIESKLGARADRTVMGTVGDVGVVALKGAVGLPQAFVGLADILTGGYAGKGVEAAGIRFDDAQKVLDTLFSPAQRQANDAVQEAKGFVDTLGAMLSNPSTIATTVGESAPQMLGGAALGRTVLAAAPKIAPWLAAAFGEGLLGAGASAEQTRGETDDGLLSAKQVFASVMSGAGTALFGAVGGRAAQRLGLADIDTALVARGVDDASAKTLKQGFITGIAKAGISEGVFEELPQSVQEQMWQNWATDRPLGEGVGKAAAQGLLAGLSMGGGFQAVSEAGVALQRKVLEREATIDRAQAEGQRLTEALQTAAQSKLRERNPETFEQLVTAMGEGADGAPQSVYIDAQVLLQSATAEELAQLLPATVEQLQEAATTNGTVEVPVAQALTYLPGTPLEQVFLQNARSAPDAMSLADAEQASKQAEQFLAQEAERVMQQAADTQAWQASSESVRTEILGQLASTGRFTTDVNEAYATLQANFFSTMAARTGMTPTELYQRYSLKVASKQVGQGGVLNAGTPAVSLGGRQIPITLNRQDERAGYQLVPINTAQFDAGFRAADTEFQSDMYVAPGGTGAAIGDRYQRFGEFAATASSVEAPTVSVDAQGRVSFGNGRHRFAFMRDNGVQSVPVAMDAESLQNAINAGYVEAQALNQAARQKAGPDAPGVGLEDGNKLGFWPALRVKLTAKLKLPAKAPILTGTTNANAAKQIGAIDAILKKFPKATESTAEWTKMMAYALGSTEVPIPPYAFIRDLNGTGSVDKLRTLTQGQIDDASHGFENAAEFRRAYIAGELGVETTGKLFMWSFLSRGVSPYTQEALFIDAFDGADKWIAMAARGEFTEAVFPEYEAWAKSVAPKGSGQPGAGATHNLNAFGQDFLFKMSRVGEDGKTYMQRLHDMMSDPNQTGKQIRREFATFGEGVGIDNKVVSFTLLVAGFNDVMVLDRVQIRQLWDDGQFNGVNLYDGVSEKKMVTGKDGVAKMKPVKLAGSSLNGLAEGARGILVYEAIERGLEGKIQQMYAELGRPQDASIGRYHWETWVADSQQEASHGTLGAILADAKGDDQAIASVSAKQGEYGAYEYGALYNRDSDGTPWFGYETPTGGQFAFSVPAFRAFLEDIKTARTGVVPTKFKVTESGNAPWYTRPEVNQQRLDERASYWADRAGGSGEGQRAIEEALQQQAADRARSSAAVQSEAGDVNGQYQQAGDGAGRGAGAGSSPLPGAPVIEGATGPDPRLVAVAEQYARDNGIDLKRQAEYVQVDPERAARIAQAYAEMAHAPQDPAVKEAYDNLIKQTVAQYRALEAAGYKFWFIDPTNDPYKSPFDAMREMRASQTMGVFPTVAGFGSGATDVDITDNPLMGDTGIQWPYGSIDGELKPVLANDLFRAVHDAFGHGLEGAGFRAQGEENAWQAHIRLFTGSAKGAITSETRGQNSWLNFGPYGETNRTAKVEDTVFADQKTGLMPEWTWTEGIAADMQDDGVLNQDGPLLAPNGKPSNLTPELYALVRTPEFKAWFGDWETRAAAENPVGALWSDNEVSKAVDENGEPLVMYHGTDTGGFTQFYETGGEVRGDLGIFMTSNREMARSYVKRGRGGDLSRDQVLDANEAGDKLSGVYPVFANIRNPQEANFEGANWSGERFAQYIVTVDGEQQYTPEGVGIFRLFSDANEFALQNGGKVEPAPDHYETTDSVVREARKYNDGAIIREVMDDGGGGGSYAGEPSDVYVAFDPAQVKSIENFGTFDPKNPNIYKQGPRGTFSPSQLLLTLNENADLSTFLHESGHFFLEVMADLASQPNAPVQIKDDMAATLKWFGVPDLATWNGYSLDEKRPYHEKWAESFEQYLFEGKAPSPEMQPLFRRFRSWMVNVYKSLTQFMRGRDLKLNDEVRQVFDRLIATDEQIAQAEEAAGMLPDFDATNEAIEALQARSLRDLKWTVKARGKVLKALEKEAKTLRAGVQAEVRAEVEQQPLYKAINWLKKGETTDPATGDVVKAEKGFRLQTSALAEMYPESMLSRPDLAKLKGMTGKEGLHPDMVADMFGFESGDALVRSIIDAEPIVSVIEGMTDQRMLERHGELATPEALEAAANEAVHNEARARSLATELKSQAEMMNPRQDTGRTASNGRAITVNAITAAAKQFAENLAARRRIKDLKNAAWQHRSAEARAGKAWQAATAKGKTEEAVQAKRDQVLNNAAVKALQDAQVEARKILEFFKKVTKGNDEKIVERGRDPDVVNAMRAILGAYDVAPKLEKSALAYMEAVAKNDPAMYAALQPSVQGAMLNAKPLGEMTMEELRGLNDELRAMWALAKRSRQMEVDGNLMDIEDAADELLNRMGEIGIPDTIPGETGAITDSQERGIKLQFAKSILSRVEQWSERLDGKFGGPFLRLVFQPIKDAADRYRTDKVAYRKRFTELLKNVAPYLPAGPIEAPELGYTFGNARDSGAAELLHAILHTGNDSNKRKLLLGRGWATQDAEGNLDTSRWDAFIQRLASEGKINQAHFQFAQGVWDLLEEMKPLAQETHRKVFGRYFAEVTANEFVDPFGNVWRGGYLPAQTDSRLVKDAKLRELAEGENESMAYAFPAAPSGFTKSRVEYNQPLLLDLRALGQHMDKVLLFSHMQGAVTDVRRLLTNKRVSYALDRIDPGAYEGMLIPWLNRSARQVVETPVVGDRKLSRFLSAARSRAGMALMFANLSNTVQQITGFTLAGVKVKPGLIMSATARFMADPKAMKTTVADSSPYMKDRMLNEVGAMNDAIEEILVNPTLLERGQAWTQRHAYFMQSAVDNTMSPIIWTAAYNQAIEQKMEHKEAVRFADGVIRQTQGTTLPEDISRFESGPGYARLFTQFVSYFNMMANTNATAVKQIADEVGLKKGAGKVLYVALAGLLAPIWVAEAIAQAFRGGPEDEDKDGWLDDWLMAVFGLGTLRGLTAQVPIVGQAAQLVINRFNDNPADDKFSLSPAVSLIESTVSAPSSVYKAIVDDGNKQKAVRDVAAAATMITGLPIYGIARPIGYLAGLAGGDVDPTGPVDLARGVVTGVASPDSKQR